MSPSGAAVYVANTASNTVSVISTATNLVTATISVGTGPEAFGLFIGGLGAAPPPPPPPAPLAAVPTLQQWALLLLSALVLAAGMAHRLRRS